jgi:hypothetical protein
MGIGLSDRAPPLEGDMAIDGMLIQHSVVCGLAKSTLDDPRPPGTPRLFFQQHFKPVGAGAGDQRARLFFPGHFIPAPFFNEGTSLVGN